MGQQFQVEPRGEEPGRRSLDDGPRQSDWLSGERRSQEIQASRRHCITAGPRWIHTTECWWRRNRGANRRQWRLGRGASRGLKRGMRGKLGGHTGSTEETGRNQHRNRRTGVRFFAVFSIILEPYKAQVKPKCKSGNWKLKKEHGPVSWILHILLQ